MLNTLVPPRGGVSDGSVSGFATSGSPSRWLWQKRLTTQLHGDRRLPQPSGRWRSKLRTTAYGHRRLFHRGCGQASSRSLGRSGVTAPCGTPPGKLLSWWWRRWLAATKLTPPPSPSSCARTSSCRRSRRRRRRRGSGESSGR